MWPLSQMKAIDEYILIVLFLLLLKRVYVSCFFYLDKVKRKGPYLLTEEAPVEDLVHISVMDFDQIIQILSLATKQDD